MMTMSDQSDEWEIYAAEMRKWRLARKPECDKPRAAWQKGPHIDSLPVEANTRICGNRLALREPAWGFVDVGA